MVPMAHHQLALAFDPVRCWHGFMGVAQATCATHLVNAFRKGLAESDFVEGQNVAVEYHSAEDQLDRLQPIVADLISR